MPWGRSRASWAACQEIEYGEECGEGFAAAGGRGEEERVAGEDFGNGVELSGREMGEAGAEPGGKRGMERGVELRLGEGGRRDAGEHGLKDPRYDAKEAEARRRQVSRVSISAGVLSVRIRAMRGKRRAKPLWWRLLGWMMSNATSSTVSGTTAR
jgi:hypothetical protein